MRLPDGTWVCLFCFCDRWTRKLQPATVNFFFVDDQRLIPWLGFSIKHWCKQNWNPIHQETWDLPWFTVPMNIVETSGAFRLDDFHRHVQRGAPKLTWSDSPGLMLSIDNFSMGCDHHLVSITIMWLKQCHKPSIWEWFLAPIYVAWGMVSYSTQPHYN